MKFIFLLLNIIHFVSLEKENSLTSYIKELAKELIINNINISEPCEKEIKKTIERDSLFIDYLINSSSLESNDISSYYSCIENNKSNYYLATFKPINDAINTASGLYDKDFSVYGICIYNNSVQCRDNDYKTILKRISNITNFSSNRTINIINIKRKSKLKRKPIHNFLLLIYSILIISLVLFSLFTSLPNILLRCFFIKRKSRVTLYNVETTSLVDKVSLFSFSKCFNFEENSDYFVCPHNTNKSYGTIGITSEEGLGYIKGILGIGIFFALFGLLFMQLMTEPYKNFDEITFENLFYNPFKSIINMSARYGPRLLFSCSGYIFMYKISCFLEDETTELLEPTESFNTSNRVSDTNTNLEGEDSPNSVLFLNDIEPKSKELLSRSEDTNTENYKEVDKYGVEKRNFKKTSTITNIEKLSSNLNQIFRPKKKDPSTIRIVSLISFYKSQLYKLFLVLLTLFFFKYTIFIFFELLDIPGPSLISFRIDYIDNIFNMEIIGRVFQYLNFKDLISKYNTTNNHSSSDNLCIMFLFWPIICEFFFFVFTTPIVFISYKAKKNPLSIFLIMIIILIFIRIILFFYHSIIDGVTMYSTLYFHLEDYYGIFSTNPIINYSYFLIGCLFGFLYFLSQRTQDENKSYLKMANNILYFIRYQNNSLLIIINTLLTLIVCLFVFFEQIYFYLNYLLLSEFKLKDYFTSRPVNIFYLIDTDIFILFIHYLCFSLFCKNEKFLIGYLSKDKWEISCKIYYSFLIFSNFTIIFILEKGETKIPIQLFSVVFYGLLCWFILFLVIYFFYVFFEFPFKRISSFIHRTNTLKKSRSYLKLK